MNATGIGVPMGCIVAICTQWEARTCFLGSPAAPSFNAGWNPCDLRGSSSIKYYEK